MSFERACGAFSAAIVLVLGILVALSADTFGDALVRLWFAALLAIAGAISFEIRHRRVQSLHRKVHRLTREHPRETEVILRKWWMRPFARFFRD